MWQVAVRNDMRLFLRTKWGTVLVLQSTTKYYKELLQCYSVLQSTSPYYKVLLQYYSVLPRTTKYYKELLCTIKY